MGNYVNIATSNFAYTPARWIWAAVSVSYSTVLC